MFNRFIKGKVGIGKDIFDRAALMCGVVGATMPHARVIANFLDKGRKFEVRF